MGAALLTAAVVVSIVSIASRPARAAVPCDLERTASIDALDVAGDLAVEVVPAGDGLWSYTVTVPAGYRIEYLDATAPVTVDEENGAAVGGGALTRGRTVVGEFVAITACLVEVPGTAVRAVSSAMPDPGTSGPSLWSILLDGIPAWRVPAGSILL